MDDIRGRQLPGQSFLNPTPSDSLLTSRTSLRLPPTILCLNCPSGRSISQEGRTMVTSSGVPSSGRSPRVFWCWPSPSITSPQDCIRSYSSSRLGCILSISFCALSGSPSECRKRTGSVPRKRRSLRHVSFPGGLVLNSFDNVELNRQRHRCPSWMELDLVPVRLNLSAPFRSPSSFLQLVHVWNDDRLRRFWSYRGGNS